MVRDVKTRSRLATLGLAAGLGLCLTTPARAQDAGSVPADTAPSAASSLELSIRARGLGFAPEVYTPGSAASLGLEPMRAPTGAGTIRMPRAAAPGERRGMYIGVTVCDPDGVERVYMVRVDEAGSLPEGPIRDGAPGPRGLYLPGRPLP